MIILKMLSIVKNLYTNGIVLRIFANISWGIISQAGGKGYFPS